MKYWTRLKELLAGLLKQGITPEKLSWTVAWGVTLSLFPVFGSTTLLCFLVACLKGYNQAAVQAANYLAAPLQLILLPVFIRAGEALFGLPAFPFNPETFFDELKAHPSLFLSQGGQSIGGAIATWAMIAFPLAMILRFVFRPVLVRALSRKESR